VADEGGRAESSVLGRGFAVTQANAALANGTAAHALDYDDSHHPSMLHPTAVLLPALLAVAQARQSSGRELIAAYLYSLDVTALLATHLNPAHYEAGWHPTATVGAIGAAAGAARLAGCDPERIRVAMGLAATQSHGLRAAFGSMGKTLHAGTAARAGVVSALLAARGFTAGPVLTGFLTLHQNPAGPPRPAGIAGKGVPVPDLPDLTVLDHSFATVVGGLSLKRFPACGVNQAPIEAALGLAARPGFEACQVSRIEVRVEPFIRNVLITGPPRDGNQARFSLEHCVAVSLLDGVCGLAQFEAGRVTAPEVRALAARVSIIDNTRARRWVVDPGGLSLDGPPSTADSPGYATGSHSPEPRSPEPRSPGGPGGPTGTSSREPLSLGGASGPGETRSWPRTEPVKGEPDMRWPCSVTVYLANGRRLEQSVAEPMGRGFGELLPEAELLAKFQDCAGQLAPKALGLLDRLEDLDDVGELARCLAGPLSRIA
jgi:2-methylcitrate dehydratase PrpD